MVVMGCACVADEGCVCVADVVCVCVSAARVYNVTVL